MTKAEELREALEEVLKDKYGFDRDESEGIMECVVGALGITREMVERVREAVCEVTTGRERGCRVVKEVGCEDVADALTTLLEVAGR